MRAPSYHSHHTIVTSSGQLPAHAHQLQRSRFVSASSSAFSGKNNNEQQQGSSNQQRKEKILAERFKTQMCRNYERKGSCPYENKCMFAHGDADLRTPEMNVRDGLFTEESIEAFRRAQRLLKKRANQAARLAAAAAANPAAATVAEADARPTEIDAFETSALNSCAEAHEATAQNDTTPPTAFPSTVTTAATPALHYANSSTCRTASASVSSAASVSSVGEGTEAELDAEAEDESVAICKKEDLLLLQRNESEEKRSLSNSSSATPYAAGARYRHNPYSASSSISLISSVASPEFAPDHQ